MTESDAIPQIASLLSDPARAAIAWTLIDGTSRPAGELAFAANVSAQSASGHLSKLVQGGLLKSDAQGRHRYFSIASREAAHLIESLASFGVQNLVRTPPHPALIRAMPSYFLYARTCYDHLAGEIAVAVMQTMLDRQWLHQNEQTLGLTPLGHEKLTQWGIDLTPTNKTRRAMARCCIDLTQRRPHLAGELGALLLKHFVERGWLLRQAKSRVVSITPLGKQAFKREFGIPPAN